MRGDGQQRPAGRGASGDRTVRLHAGTTTDGIGPCELVIIAQGLRFERRRARRGRCSAPMRSCRPSRTGSARRAVAPIVGADRLAVGVVGGFGASLRAPGHVHHNAWRCALRSLRRPARERLAACAAIWESAGFKVALFDDLRRMVWEKLIMNVTSPAPAA